VRDLLYVAARVEIDRVYARDDSIEDIMRGVVLGGFVK
jgi:hypothetical protein